MIPFVKTLFALCRVSNLPTVWMNVLTAALLARHDAPPPAIALLMIACSASYAGGMALNDYFDREYDARTQPFRPIPAGRIGEKRARALAAGLLAVGFGLLAFAPEPTSLLPGLALLAAIYAYDRWHKEFAGSVFLMASTRTLVFVVTSWAITGAVPPLVLVAGGASFLWTLSVTVVARWEGRRGRPYAFPVIPWMIAAMSLLDGFLLAIFVEPGWLFVGLGMMAATRFGQQYVRGD